VGYIRYRVDVLDALKRAGISSYRIYKDKLLPQSTLQRIREGNTSVNVGSIATLCSLLHCQPGDILEYVPDEDERQPGHHQDAADA
jgi:putative transcriptional regulator